MNKGDELLKVGTRVTHFDGGSHGHGLGTILGYNGVRRLHYLEENFKDATEMVAVVDKAVPQVGLLGGLVSSFYNGERCPYIVQWDNGYKDAYEPDSARELTAESYEFCLRSFFKKFAEMEGYKVSACYAPYDDECTQKAWNLFKTLIASLSKLGKLEYPIPN